MKVEEVQWGLRGYLQTVDLRKRVLRAPLGIEWTEEEKGWEPEERHFALWDGDALVACVVIRPLEGGAVKLRQMAVEPPRQVCGAGRRLLEGVEEQLRVEGVSRIELNARDTAAGFYRKLGYRKVGGEFVEVTIPHWKMVKRL